VPSQRPDVLIFDPVTKDFENVTVDVQTDIWKFI
jgi:hypothetical protein